MKAVILSTTIPVLLAFAMSASASYDQLGRRNTRSLKKTKKGLKKSHKKGSKDDSAAGCEDPLAAIMHALQCIADADGACAGKAYAEGFKKLHNGRDTLTDFTDDPVTYWTQAFLLVKLSLTFDHQLNIGPNMASIRYIEGVEFTDGLNLGLPASDDYPFGAYYEQHEHALVTVDND